VPSKGDGVTTRTITKACDCFFRSSSYENGTRVANNLTNG
jgi:hypothetical protein